MIKISKDLEKIFDKADNEKKFNEAIKSSVLKIKEEVSRIYHSKEVKDLENFYLAECVYLALAIKGFEVYEPEKKYVVILPEVGSNTGIYWNYTYINGNMEVDYADIPTSVTQFTKRDLLALPKWARNLAKEVKEWEKDTLSF